MRSASTVALPQLPGITESAAVDFGDWHHTIANSMGDISDNSAVWWQAVMESMAAFYNAYVKADQFNRLTMEPRPADELKLEEWQGVDRTAATMRMGAVAENIKLELIACRVQITSAMMCRLAVLYRPGSTTERAQLRSSPRARGGHDSFGPLGAGQGLRQWGRYLQRARDLGIVTPDLGIVTPDPSVLLKAIDGLVAAPFAANTQILFVSA